MGDWQSMVVEIWLKKQLLAGMVIPGNFGCNSGMAIPPLLVEYYQLPDPPELKPSKGWQKYPRMMISDVLVFHEKMVWWNY